MKIAVLSDIHGNKLALEAVIADINKNDVDHIIILGDLITDLPDDTNDVLDMVRSLDGYVIKGNRELYIQNGQEAYEYDQYAVTYMTEKILSEKHKKYIHSLPESISLKFHSQATLKLVHGSPFSASELIFEDDQTRIVDCLDAISENMLLCGHSHAQWYKKVQNKTILNPGSVGLNFSGDKTAKYAIMELGDDDWDIALKSVYYDFDLMKQKYDLTIPWIRLCIKGVEDGCLYTIRFLEEAKAICNKWPIPNDVWNNLFEEWCDKGII